MAICELRFFGRVCTTTLQASQCPIHAIFSHNRVFGLRCSSSLLVIVIALVVDHVEEPQFVNTFAGGHHP
jgi:hypothetical protein